MNIKYEKSGRGNLPFMLCWQSLDGRFMIKYYSTLNECRPQFHHLINLRLKPHIYRKLDTLNESTTIAFNEHKIYDSIPRLSQCGLEFDTEEAFANHKCTLKNCKLIDP